MSTSMSLSTTDQQIWKKVVASKNRSMTESQIAQSMPGMKLKEVVSSLTSLIDLRLLSTTKGPDNVTIFRANSADEAAKRKSLTHEQTIVLRVIQTTGNTGISQKTIRSRLDSDLINTMMLRRVIESLEKDKVIRSFKNVNAPTISLYCDAKYEPSSEVTGGPWYTEGKEYDEQMVDVLRMACLQFIRIHTHPKPGKCPPSALALVSNPVYPVGKTPKLPSPYAVHKFITDRKLVSTPLSVKNIMEVMRMLELDGLVEVVKPTDGPSAPLDDDMDYEPNAKRRRKGNVSDDDLEDEERELRREKEREKVKEMEREKKRKARDKKKAKEKEKKERKREKKRAKKEKKRKRKRSRGSPGDESDDELRPLADVVRGENEKEKKRCRTPSVSSVSDDSETDSGDSDSDTDSDLSTSSSQIDDPSKSTGRKFALSRNTNAVPPAGLLDLSDTAIVYRATSRLLMPLGQTQVPCGMCPVFAFCEEGGPVNSGGCEYLDGWLSNEPGAGGWEGRHDGVSQGQHGQAGGGEMEVDGAER